MKPAHKNIENNIHRKASQIIFLALNCFLPYMNHPIQFVICWRTWLCYISKLSFTIFNSQLLPESSIISSIWWNILHVLKHVRKISMYVGNMLEKNLDRNSLIIISGGYEHYFWNINNMETYPMTHKAEFIV